MATDNTIQSFIQRFDSCPVEDGEFTFEFRSWLSTLVDSLNSAMEQIESRFLDWGVNAAATIALTVNTGVIATGAAPVLTLPAVALVGDTIQVCGGGVGNWVLQPNAGQTIKVSSGSASTSITATSVYDAATVVCIIENTTWAVTASQTAGFTIT